VGVAWPGSPLLRHRTSLGLGAGDATLTQYRRSSRGRDCDLRLDGAAPAAEALYVEAIAEQLARDEADVAVEIYPRRSQACGARPWAASDVLAPEPFRLYRATAGARSVPQSDDQRPPVKAVS
jgi:hypothetical protein